MYKKMFLFILIAIMISSLIANDKIQNISFDLGIGIAAGARYDNIRMCVASPAGFPGGPAAEFLSFYSRLKINRLISLNMTIPIGRPILFAIAFKVLQFEPQLDIKFNFPVFKKRKNIELFAGAGTGLSLHYGPDYNSSLALSTTSFMALGPIFSVSFGFEIFGKQRVRSMIIGLKPYFEYLAGSGRQGIVAGGDLFFGLNMNIF